MPRPNGARPSAASSRVLPTAAGQPGAPAAGPATGGGDHDGQPRPRLPARVRVRFADTDAQGVAYHGNYLAFLETGRVEAMRQIGQEYTRIVARGLHLVVVEAVVRYVKPAVFDDVLLISTCATDIGRARFAFDYRVIRESDAVLLATGRTVHACVDAATMRPMRLPDWLLGGLRQLGTP